MRKYLKIKKIFFPYDVKEGSIPNRLLLNKTDTHVIFKQNKKIHKGYIIAKYKKFKILDCKVCKFIHCIPFPKEKELNLYYKKKFYEQNRKKNYFSLQKKQIIWWNRIFQERLDNFKKILGKTGNILDIGCGPGFFLKYAKKKGWHVNGIDSSESAINFAKKNLKLKNVDRTSYQDLAFKKNLLYDVIYSNGVLEHIDDPLNFIKIAHKLLKKKGLLFLSVANDFNIFQFLSMKNISKPWWILPPEHINYFRPNDLKKLLKKNKFKIINISSSFPIEIFLLMGQNYIKNKNIGKYAHQQRVKFEKHFEDTDLISFKQKIYEQFSSLGFGRAIEIIVQKK